jgi:hypothetical protein
MTKIYMSSTYSDLVEHRRAESRCLLGLGKTLLLSGKLSEARRYCTEALTLDVPETARINCAVSALKLRPSTPPSPRAAGGWRRRPTANGKRYLRVGDRGCGDEQLKRPRKSLENSGVFLNTGKN